MPTRRLAQNQETDWDFAQDVLVTHGPPGVLNTVTGVCGLAAMLWLYGVAWHQPMAESIAWARTTIAEAMPSASTLTGGFAGGAGRISGMMASTPATSPTPSSPSASPTGAPSIAPSHRDAAVDGRPRFGTDHHVRACERAGHRIAVIHALDRRPVAADRRRARRDLRRSQGEDRRGERGRSAHAARGQLAARAELCKAWTELELGNAESYRCLGTALQAQGYHQDAINAFRKAKQYDPTTVRSMPPSTGPRRESSRSS